MEDVPRIDLDFLRAKVGGRVEYVALEEEVAGIGMYLNEEGKLEGLPLNERATYLAHTFEAIFGNDYIVGDTVLVGPADNMGNETGLTDTALILIAMAIGIVGDEEEGQQA